LGSPIEVGAWHLGFLVIVVTISARGLNRGVELANKIRAPGLLVLLLILTGYSLATGDVARGLAFAFAPHLHSLSADTVLAAVGQAFFATGVGMGMMIAYGAYIPESVSLTRTALATSAAILLVSLLATILVFPLVYRYGMDPAQGTQLVFNVLPSAFAEMPGGRLIGSLFFLLLIFAAVTPTVAGIEPSVAWLEERFTCRRSSAAFIATGALWLFGTLSALSFNILAHWYPLTWIERFKHMTFYEAVDFISSNVLLAVGAVLTCALIGWRMPASLFEGALPEERPLVRTLLLFLIRYVCPIAILVVLVESLR
jgi:neurotransmitter:Na+ symporter, NSS family